MDKPLQVINDGSIADAGPDYLQVDFANEQLGGGALHSGCVQVRQFFSSNDLILFGPRLPILDPNHQF